MHTENISDKELVNECIVNNRRYQELLYRKFADDMFSVALMYADSQEDACDILQDAFIRVFKYLGTFKFDCPLRMWIRRIVVNTSINYYNKKKRERELFSPLPESIDVPIDNILAGLNFKDIIKLVNELPRKARTVLKLYTIEGYKHREIAEMMGVTEGTSKSQLNRAKQLLIDSIEKHYE